MKLAALDSLTDVSKITKIMGDYNGGRPYLYVDKIMGGVNFCLGLSQEDDVYVPSSALLEDIKKLRNEERLYTDSVWTIMLVISMEFGGF